MLESSAHTQAFPLVPWIGFTLPALVVSTSHCCGLFLIIFLHCAWAYFRMVLLVLKHPLVLFILINCLKHKTNVCHIW